MVILPALRRHVLVARTAAKCGRDILNVASTAFLLMSMVLGRISVDACEDRCQRSGAALGVLVCINGFNVMSRSSVASNVAISLQDFFGGDVAAVFE